MEVPMFRIPIPSSDQMQISSSVEIRYVHSIKLKAMKEKGNLFKKN